jgi:hypothetical protein
MAASTTVSNYWKYHQLNNYVAKAFVILLMQPGFVYSNDDHIVYSAFSASEVPSAYGYVKGSGIVLPVSSVVIDNTNDWGKIVFGSVSFTPSGGDISIGGAMIWDLSDDVVVGYMDAGGTITIVNGQPYVFQNLQVRNK